MNIPVDFFRDEVRCGFRVPTAIKQAWAAQLTVLHEIDRICEGHGISYFAEWGTLLGAVRHRGFIPWDDDLDIGMKREDYIRFRKVADRELPEGYVIHDFERQEGHWLFLARVVNRRHFSFDPGELTRWHNYPWLAGIDIFILDYRYRDPEKEIARGRDTLRLIALADAIVQQRIDASKAQSGLDGVREQYGEEFKCPEKDASARDIGVALYGLAQKQMARCPREESDRLVQLFPWGLKGAEGLPKEWYDRTVRIPFEFTDIPVPAVYSDILTNRYGRSWMEIRKVWGGHDYPSFEGQKENLRRIADFELPGFSYRPGMGNVRDVEKKPAGREISVLFLPVGEREWTGMRPYYDSLISKGNTRIMVVPLPVFKKNALGEIEASDEEMFLADHYADYPSDLPMERWYDLDPSRERWDIIVIQDPYDAENPCLTIPPVFYSSELLKYTRQLVYIPSFVTDEIGDNDRNDLYNLKHYVTAPGVINADRVIVQSENIRRRYIDALTAFAGEETGAKWEHKVQSFIATEEI